MQKPTRIVARSPEDVAKAVGILHIVGNKLAKREGAKAAADDQAVMQQQQGNQQQKQEHSAAAAPAMLQILVFQPQQVGVAAAYVCKVESLHCGQACDPKTAVPWLRWKHLA